MAERFIKSNGLEIWTEHVGDKKNPPVLLIMGLGAQSIFWPDVFFNGLADEGFFVIRYDHRNTGKSSTVDFGSNPYTVNDLIKDALAVLDAYTIDYAHIVGTSLGGFIGLSMALSFAQRVRSLTLLMTSSDLSVAVDAVMGVNAHNHVLPPPTQKYITFIRSHMFDYPKTKQDLINLQMNMWKLLSGSHDFDEQYVRALVERACNRIHKYGSLVNQALAVSASRARIDNLDGVKVPTLIIQGEQDPIFSPEHGDALARGIAHAKLVSIAQMGHVASVRVFEQQILPVVVDFLKKVK